MKVFIAFCKKEVLESVRTYRFVVMLAAFALLGLMNPFIAKMLPDLLNGADLGGMTLILPEATAMDSWAQFYSNNGQLGILTLVIVFCGITANDLSKGTLVNILTKGMKRSTVIFSKFTVAFVTWTLAYFLSLAVTYAYNVYFWGSETLLNALLAFTAPWIYGVFLLSLMILGGVCFKNFYGSLILTGGAIIVMSMLNIAPQVRKFNPMSISGDTFNLLTEQKLPSDFTPALIICLALIVMLTAGSVIVFNRKQI
jgi:ABC-2 type transport system permease protein